LPNLYPVQNRNAQDCKKAFYLHNWMRFYDGSTPNYEKNYQNTKKYASSEKEPKIRIRATRQYFQSQPNIIKKMMGTPNQPIKTKIYQQNYV
jgi:hypothetical protein